MMNNLTINPHKSPFDAIAQIDGQGNEFWSARDLMVVLGYEKWQNFSKAINRAFAACRNSRNDAAMHFLLTSVKTKGRTGDDWHLSRYACYLVAMNGDPSKPEIAAAQSYFAIKTREAETVIPQQNDRLRELELQNSILSQQLQLRQLDNTMLQLHGKETVFALRGMTDQLVREEVKTTEIVEPDTGTCTNILTAEQLKEAIQKRTGQKIRSMKQVTDALRKQGRDDLLMPVRRSQVTEYVQPENLDEVIEIVFRNRRQMLIGE